MLSESRLNSGGGCHNSGNLTNSSRTAGGKEEQGKRDRRLSAVFVSASFRISKASPISLEKGILYLRSLHKGDLRLILDKHKPGHGECIAEMVDFVLVDPSYNVQQLRQDEILKLNVRSEE